MIYRLARSEKLIPVTLAARTESTEPQGSCPNRVNLAYRGYGRLMSRPYKEHEPNRKMA